MQDRFTAESEVQQQTAPSGPGPGGSGGGSTSGTATGGGQTPPTSTPSSGTNATGTGTGSGGEINTPAGTGGAGGGGGDGWLSGMPDLPDPAQMGPNIVEGLANSFATGAQTVISGLNNVSFGVSAPGVIGDASTWLFPTNGQWPAVWTAYWTSAAIALVALTFVTMNTLDKSDGRDLEKKLGEIGFTVAMILVGFPLTALVLHGVDALSTGLAPGFEEFSETPGSVGKLAVGGLLGAVLLVFQTGPVLVGSGIIVFEGLIIKATVAAWPFIWVLRCSETSFSDIAGGIGLASFFGILGAKLGRAGLAFLLFQMEWSASDAGASAEALFANIVGLLIIFIGIPYMVKEYFIPEATTILGAPAVKVAENSASRIRESARSKGSGVAKQYAASARGAAASGVRNLPSPSSTRRKVQYRGGRGEGWDASAATGVSRDYSPDPEPGASMDGGSRNSRSQASSHEQNRINSRLNGRGGN